MSKNTRNTAFRKVDVDQYDEEQYQEEATADTAVAGPSDAEVNAYVNKGSLVEALKYVLKNAPTDAKNQMVKDKALQCVVKVLTAFKTAEIEGAVGALDQNQLDVLMKYIYRGFELPTDGLGAQLLVWHDKVFAVTGLSSIVRVLSGRRRV